MIFVTEPAEWSSDNGSPSRLRCAGPALPPPLFGGAQPGHPILRSRCGAVAVRLTALLVLASAAACSSRATTTTGPTPTKCAITLGVSPASLDAGGGTGTVSVTA